MLTIDGNYLEGGGQIVRNALALSALTGKAFEVAGIRKDRYKSGLKAQHLHAVSSLQKFCSAVVEGNELGSPYLKFIPKKFRPVNRLIDIGTAGSVTLLMQSLLPPLMLSRKKVILNLIGGTDAKWAMPVDYFMNVFIPILRPYADIGINLLKRGYYPKGQGHIEISIKSKFDMETRKLAPKFNLLDRGSLLCTKGVSHASKDLEKLDVALRQKKSAELFLKSKADILAEYCDTPSTGSGIVLWAVYENSVIGADSLGERGKKAEAVGFEAARNLLKEMNSGRCVDGHLADNLIPFLGIFGGSISVSEITKHTLTNVYVTELFLDIKFSVDEKNKVIAQNK